MNTSPVARAPSLSPCPPSVEISSWYDGQGTEDLGAHVNECARCTRTVKSYRALDQAVRRGVVPRSSLAQQIVAACERDLASRTFILVWPVPVWRVASVAALVTLGLGALFLYAWNPADPMPTRGPDDLAMRTILPAQPPPIIAGVRGAPPAVPAPFVEFAPLRIAPSTVGPVLQGGSGLLSVSAPGTHLGGAAAGTGLTTLKEATSDSVRHVWVVADATRAVAALRTLLPQGTVLNPLATRGGPRVTYRVLLSDESLQALVDRLAGAGFSLVSPALPQPGARDRLLVQGKPVLYEMEFVAEPAP